MTQTLPESAAPSSTATGDPQRMSGGHLVAESGKPPSINVWVVPDVYAPGTMNQTMCK